MSGNERLGSFSAPGSISSKKRSRSFEFDDFTKFEISKRTKQTNVRIHRETGAAESTTAPSTLMFSRNSKNGLISMKSKGALLRRPALQDKTSINNTGSRFGMGMSNSSKQNAYTPANKFKNEIMNLHRMNSRSQRCKVSFESKSQTTQANTLDSPTSTKKVLASLGSSAKKLQLSQLQKTQVAGNREGFNEVTDEILNKFSFTNTNNLDNISMQAISYIREFIEWFKANRFDFVVVDSRSKVFEIKVNNHFESEATKREVSDKVIGQKDLITPYEVGEKVLSSKILSILTHKGHDATKLKASHPTHMVDKSTKVGKFLVSATVRNIKTKQSLIIFLLRTDVRIDIKPNNLLSLNEDLASSLFINGEYIQVYTKWLIYKDQPVGIEFF